MDAHSSKQPDKRIVSLASDIADARDNSIAPLLLNLKDILDSVPQGSVLSRELKADIWSYDLLHVICMTLKQKHLDFPHSITGGWRTVQTLVEILSLCSIGVDPPDSTEFYKHFIPEVCDLCLSLSKKVQSKYVKTSSALREHKEDMLTCMKSILDSLSRLISVHDSLVTRVLMSPALYEMLRTDDKETCRLILITIQSANRMIRNAMGTVTKKVMDSIMDELVWKVAATKEIEIASSAVKTLIIICESHPPIVKYICQRYDGIRMMLNQWNGQGFGYDLRKFIYIIETGNIKKAEAERQFSSACLIQATWRMYLTRKRLQNANEAFSKFHKSFRAKRELQTLRHDFQREGSALHHMLVIKRRQAMRRLHEKQFHIIDKLHPAQVDRFMSEEENRAAILVQKHWRGYHTRQKLHNTKMQHNRTRAAVIIQRAVRRWLSRMAALHGTPGGVEKSPALSDERRVAILESINTWRQEHQLIAQTPSEQQALHDKCQTMLRQKAMKANRTLKKMQKRDALIARIHVDAQLILNAPKLSEAEETDIDLYKCHAVPIATKARYNHNNEMRLIKQPWWKKLGDEYQDNKQDDDWNWKIF